MKFFIKSEDRLAYINSKLGNIAAIESIEPIKKLPREITYISWSFGGNVERSYRYKVALTEGGEIYCQVTTLLNIWIVRHRFYRKNGGRFLKLDL